jgi:hypothetical protein
MGARVKALLGLTAVGIFASALVPSAAYADGVNFRFCNVSGNIPYPHDEYVAFPYRGGYTSTIQPPGGCWSTVLSGVANDEAVGYRNVNGQWLAVATKYFSDSSGSVEFDF